MNNLDKYRASKDFWSDASYLAQSTEERGVHDANEMERYSILLALQYDHNDSDEELIRYLFRQEVIAREKDSFQGIGEALWLGAYLLAAYRNAEDIPLFCRAKFANFDTACGFDREFMFVALRDRTEEYVAENYPEVHEEIQGDYESLDLTNRLDKWWDRIASKYPTSEMDEEPYVLFERYMDLGQPERAKEYLDKWIAIEPDSDTKKSKLKYAYQDLGEYEKAIDLVKEELDSKESHWDKVSVSHTLLGLYTKMGAPVEGLQVIESIGFEFRQFDDWIDIGLGRMAIHAAFEYSLNVSSDDVARAAFNHAYKWFKKMDSIAYIGLEAGWKAAERCGYKIKAKKLKYLASREKSRIKNM